MTVGLGMGQNLSALRFEPVYHQLYDLSSIPDEQKELMKRHAMKGTFPVAVAILLHFITFGIFTLIYMGLKHSKLPLIKHDDFSAGKAIGFMFIPFFNLYWIFIFWTKLADRINLQFRLRDLPAPIPQGLIITTVIIGYIPYLNFLISGLILYPICIGFIQSASNKLAFESL